MYTIWKLNPREIIKHSCYLIVSIIVIISKHINNKVNNQKFDYLERKETSILNLWSLKKKQKNYKVS